MSLSDQWSPTSAQVTVLQARGLRIKGKNGTNDAYAVMQLGKDKFQTSVAEKSVAPVWREEASFDMPSALSSERGTLRVHVLHRALVGPDKLLGQAVIDLLQLREDRSRDKTQWFKLLDKSGKPDKDRGELLVEIQFTRNNMTASMFDISAAGKSRSRLGKFKDKVRGKKKEDGFSETSSTLSQVMTDSEGEGDSGGEEAVAGKEQKKKSKVKSLFSHKTNLQKSFSQSMSVLPGKNSSLSGSVSSGLNVEASEGKKKFKFLSHKRTASSDKKELNKLAAEQTNLCINGSHVYCEEPAPRSSRASSSFSLASSGVGSMEDVPDSSPPSVSSRGSVRRSSPWTEEEEEEEVTLEEEAQQVDEDMLRRIELEKMAEEEAQIEERERRRKEEEEQRRIKEVERLKEEEERGKREEEARIEKERQRIEEEEEQRRRELARKEEEERLRLKNERKRIEMEEEEERMRQMEMERERLLEEERKRQEEELRVEREREEEALKLEEERKRLEKEEEEERIRLEGEKRRLMEEEERSRKEREEQRRLEEEEEEKRRQRELQQLEEEKRKREEEEKRRQKELQQLEQEKRKREEEEKRRQKEQLEEEKIKREEEEEKRRQAEEEEQRRQAEERQRIEEERRKQEQDRIRKEEELMRLEKERAEEEMKREREEQERLEAEQRRQKEEKQRIERENALERERLAEEKRRKDEEERVAQATRKTAQDVASTNPFDESDEEEGGVQNAPENTAISARQRCKLPAERNTCSFGDVGTAGEKRQAPKPPRMNASGRQPPVPREAHANQQSKEIKTASVLPQRAVQNLHTSAPSSHRVSNVHSEQRSSGRRRAPQRPAPSDGEQVSSEDSRVSSKQTPAVTNLNPFEDDPSAPDSVTQQNAETDPVCGVKIKSTKTAHAPAPPSTNAPSADTEPDVPEDKGCPRVQQTLHEDSLPVQVEVKDAPPVPTRRLIPVRPLNPQEQDPVSSIQAEKRSISTGEINTIKGAGPYVLLTQDELISLVLKQESQLLEKSKKISELEQYIDNLLVRVMEEAPNVLMTMTPLK